MEPVERSTNSAGKDNDHQNISFLIPVFNSQLTIPDLILRIENEMKQQVRYILHEILLINDASSDSSAQTCLDICQGRDYVKLIDLAFNIGQHRAIIFGLGFVTGDLVVCMDDDLQNPPEEIGKLLSTFENYHYDVVYAKYGKKEHSPLREFGTRLNNQLWKFLYRSPAKIYLSSFFLLKREILKETSNPSHSFSYVPDLLFQKTKNIGNAEVVHNIRQKGQSGYSLKKLLQFYRNFFATKWKNNSCRLFKFAWFFLAIGLILGILGMTGTSYSWMLASKTFSILAVFLTNMAVLLVILSIFLIPTNTNTYSNNVPAIIKNTCNI